MIVNKELKENDIEVLRSKPWLSRREFALLYDMSLATIDRHRKAGVLEYRKVGGRPFFRNEMPGATM